MEAAMASTMRRETLQRLPAFSLDKRDAPCGIDYSTLYDGQVREQKLESLHAEADGFEG
jgi:hypothetical protein